MITVTRNKIYCLKSICRRLWMEWLLRRSSLNVAFKFKSYISLHFLLCALNVWGHELLKFVDSRVWKSLHLVLTITLFLSTDDLPLFGEVSSSQMELMLDCLNSFRVASGEKVNPNKTKASLMWSKMDTYCFYGSFLSWGLVSKN